MITRIKIIIAVFIILLIVIGIQNIKHLAIVLLVMCAVGFILWFFTGGSETKN